MFNPQARLHSVDLGDGRQAFVLDDVLRDPQALRARAIANRQQFQMAPHNAYPGLEWRMGAEVDGPLAEFFLLRIRALLGARRTEGLYSRLSLATLQPPQLRPLQRLCHRDRFGTTPQQLVAACTLYLFDDPALGGTSFWRPRRPVADIEADFRRWHPLEAEDFTRELGSPPAYLTESNAHFERVAVVPAAFNRAVFYDGSGFHSSHITRPDLLSDDPARGRLTLNGFFICRRQAAAGG